MNKHERLLEHILTKRGDTNVPFAALCQLLRLLGFEERIKGDHHIFTLSALEEIINLQAKHGKAKPYKVRQIRNLVLRYDLKIGE
jgi:hypothetical protein